MFKRFQVVDLFHGDKNFDDIKEWVRIDERLPNGQSGMYKVKLDNECQVVAYYFQDKCASLARSKALSEGKSTYAHSYFLDRKTKEPLQNVIEWGES